MTRQINLHVNDIAINTDYFVAGFIDHVIGGIITSLKDTGEIEDLVLTVEQGDVIINLNGADVPLTYFPKEIIKATVMGLVTPLKGVKDPVKVKIRIQR